MIKKEPNFSQRVPQQTTLNHLILTDLTALSTGIAKAIIDPILKAVFEIIIKKIANHPNLAIHIEDSEGLGIFLVFKKYKKTNVYWQKEGEPVVVDSFLKADLPEIIKSNVRFPGNVDKSKLSDMEFIEECKKVKGDRFEHMQSKGYQTRAVTFNGANNLPHLQLPTQ
jgi:hypothetical protein